MFRFHIGIALLTMGMFCGMLGRVAPASADDFRVKNEVFLNGQKEPSSQSTTIFQGGFVYDCMKTPDETVVFDKAAGKFVLLNMANQTRAELTTNDVTAFIGRFETQLRSMIAKKPDALLEFMAAPKFQEQFDEPSGELTLSSPLVNYKLTLSADQGGTTAGQYRDFSDGYARLNTLLTPGALPPFGRLAVNAAVAQRNAIATGVTLTITSAKLGRRTIRSTHEIIRPLTQADLEQVARIRKSMTDFKPISFEKYRKSEAK